MKNIVSWEKWREKGLALFKRYKFVLLIIAAGLVLLLWPGTKPSAGAAVTTAETPQEEEFDLSGLEKKLSEALSKVQGAGDVTVMLTVQGGSRRVLAEDGDSSRSADGSVRVQRDTVVMSGGSGAGEVPVLIQQLYPSFQGALVICPGGGDPQVRLKLMEAVSALTGLGADKISICKGKG